MSHRLACLVAVAACSSSPHNGAMPDTPLAIDSPPDTQAAGSGFSVVRQFDGDTGPGLAACQATGGHCDRPDFNMASDGTHVVQVTWQHVNVYDYSGQLTSSMTLSQLITSVGLVPTTANGAPPYEAHVVFDEHVGRWIITASCRYDCVLVSATSDPAGAWGGIYLNNNGTDPGIHLGYDKNGVYLSEFDSAAHDANTASFSYVDFAIPSAEIAWTGTFAPTHLNKSAGTPLDGQPAIDNDTTKAANAPAYFLCKTCASGGCQNSTNFAFSWLLTQVTWSGTTATYAADQLVPSTFVYNTPVNAPQAGSTVQLRVIEDHRVIDAVQRGSHVYGVLGSGPCTSNCGAQGADANDMFFWVDLDCTTPAACTVAVTGKASDPSLHLFYPSIGVDSAGNAGVVAAASSASTNISLYAYRHLATDATGALSAPLAVTTGTQPYTCINATQVSFANALGIGTVRDPNDGTKLWTTQQYGASASPCVWSTRLVEYQLN
jgi:hypothetical protein